MGEWEGSRWDDLESEDTVRYRHWMENWESDAPPGGESLVTFEARVRRWHEDLPEGRILLIAHAGVVRALRVLRQGISWSDAMSLPVEHLALTRV